MRQPVKLISGLLLLSYISFLFGCAPPTPKVDNSGIKIEKITQAVVHKPFETMLLDGLEAKVSRDPIGEFGGSFFTASLGHGPKTFNPLTSKDATSASIGGLMFTGLLETDPYSGQMVPHLAKSVEILPDKVTYVVTLRKGLTWSDGHTLTADDVVFTWNELIKPGLGNPSNRDVLMVDGKLPSVEKIDELTIRFKTPIPFAPFMESLSISIFPKHIVAPIVHKNPKQFESLWGVNADPKTFVTNGPFMIEEYQSGQRVTLKRNPRYFMVNAKGQHLPYLDRYVIDFVSDENSQFLQFQQNRVDQLSVAGSQVFEMRHLQNVAFKMFDLGPASGSQFLVFNLNPRKNKDTNNYYVRPEASQWFRDLNFRKAVDYAIDREAMVGNILRGVGKPLFTAESLASTYLNKSIALGHPRDLKTARTLLRQSGFTWDKTQRLIDKHGHRVEFELATNSGNLGREATGVQVKNDLAEIGIKVNFRPIDFNVLVGRMDTASWEAIIMGLTGSNTEPHGGKNVWTSTGGLHLMNQRIEATDSSTALIRDPWEIELDNLFNTGAKTIGYEARRPIYEAYQKVVYDHALMLYLYCPNSIVAVKNRVQNFDPTPFASFHNIESIWVKK